MQLVLNELTPGYKTFMHCTWLVGSAIALELLGCMSCSEAMLWGCKLIAFLDASNGLFAADTDIAAVFMGNGPIDCVVDMNDFMRFAGPARACQPTSKLSKQKRSTEVPNLLSICKPKEVACDVSETQQT